jgi:hypothetical protein
MVGLDITALIIIDIEPDDMQTHVDVLVLLLRCRYPVVGNAYGWPNPPVTVSGFQPFLKVHRLSPHQPMM